MGDNLCSRKGSLRFPLGSVFCQNLMHVSCDTNPGFLTGDIHTDKVGITSNPEFMLLREEGSDVSRMNSSFSQSMTPLLSCFY